jgi:hypothetical protein
MSNRIARIYISGDRKSIQGVWNASHPENPILAGAIALDTGSPRYQELQSIYRRRSVEHEMTWNETQEGIYSQTDLSEFEILTLWITGSAGPGDNTYGRTYERIRKCTRCGSDTLGARVAALHLNFEEIDNTDLSLTDHWETVCSERFQAVLKERKIHGVFFEPIQPAKDTHSDRQLYQLLIAARLGPLAPSTPIVREGRCELCGEYRNVGLEATESGEGRELRFPLSSYHGEAVAQTQEQFGDRRKFPLIVISQNFYQLLLNNRISGWHAEPAHLENG